MHRFVSLAALCLLLPAAARADQPKTKLPDALVKMIDAAYAGNASAQANVKNLFTHSAEAFAAHWDAYQARRKEVATVLADADAKRAAGDVDGAIATLRGAITHVDVDQYSSIKRQLVEARDAELPAIAALMKLAAAKHDYPLVFDLAPDLAARRYVTDDVDAERMKWFAFRNEEALSNLSGGVKEDTHKQIEALTRDADAAAAQGKLLASGLQGSLDALGVHFAWFNDVKSAKKGDWIFATLSHAKLAGKKLTYHLLDTQPLQYGCHDTDKVDYLNPVNGVVVYHRDCKYKPFKLEVWVDAALAQEASAAVTKSPMPIGVFGRVEKAGPHWKLADATVVDLDSTTRFSAWVPDERETIGDGGKIGVEKR